ncbi:chemotaxis protein CheW [Paenibacillus puldeungensis]|uniref:Chemotaxis protein CheW n=1 Tax=Paenibacillus puldeungensis TaxID=696536 RepID=A0ABW3RXD0_9BACL
MVSGREQYIQFDLGQEKYAIHISEVLEIIKMPEISSIPNAGVFVKGVISLREAVVPVISLSRVLGMEESSYTKLTRIVIVPYKEENIGVIVDRVDKVTTFSDIQPFPNHARGGYGVNLYALGLLDDTIVGILKLNHILDIVR